MEIVKNLIEYIAIITSGIILVYKTDFVLKYYQQSHYQFTSFKKIIRHYYLSKWHNLIFGLSLFIMFLGMWYVQLAYSLYLIVILYFMLKDKAIIKLKRTSRIYRNYLVLLIVGTIFSSLILLIFPLPELISSLAIIIILLPFLIFLSSLIIWPIEKLISIYYKKLAIRKVNKVKPRIIGITGSFGKTSTKNILYDFLKEKYITVATKKSYNTVNGLSITINEDLNVGTEFLILEMGASRVGDLDKLLKFGELDYAILTGITHQHLETFKSIENIISEKLKIVNSLKENSVCFINGDDELLNKYEIKTKAKVIKFGLNSENDYYATNIEVDEFGMSFKINFKNGFKHVKTKLLGRHNILNIIVAFALAYEIGINLNDLEHYILQLMPVKHRLSIEQTRNHLIIDDSFNSNKVGFLNALEVLGFYPSPKILITPGIVEAGILEEEINYNLGEQISKTADEVLLIETTASNNILRSLNDLGYKNVKMFNSFKEARDYTFEQYKKATILIENDVSDIYKI